MGESSKINVDKVRDAITAWGTAITTFNSNKLRASDEDFFERLSSVQLDNGFISSYDNNNLALENALNLSKQSIISALDNMTDIDDNVMNELRQILGLEPLDTGGGDGRKPSGSTPSGGQLVDNSKQQLDAYKNMSMNDLGAVVEELTKLAKANNTTLDQILNDSQYSTKIHSALLLSPNIPDEFKVLIENGQTNISQKILQSMFYGAIPELVGLDETTIMTVKNYMTMVANNNNTSLEQLLIDERYSNQLSESLGSFKGVTNYIKGIKEEEVSPSLLSVYDGEKQENMDSSGMSIMREYINQLAQSNNMDAETMLTTENNVSPNLNGFGKTSIFMDTMSAFNPKEAGNIISALLNLKGGK